MNGILRFQGRRLGDKSEIHRLLDILGAEHGEPCGPCGHHIRMVAEYRQPLARKGAGRDVEYCRRELTCYLIHVGDDEKQSLRG